MGIGVFSGSVTSFFNKVVQETFDYRESKNVTRPDFLQLLIQLYKNGYIEDEGNQQEKKVKDWEVRWFIISNYPGN